MSDELADIIRRSIEAHGATRTARALGLSVEATCRLAGRLPTQSGTIALARANIGRLSTIGEGPRAA